MNAWMSDYRTPVAWNTLADYPKLESDIKGPIVYYPIDCIKRMIDAETVSLTLILLDI